VTRDEIYAAAGWQLRPLARAHPYRWSDPDIEIGWLPHVGPSAFCAHRVLCRMVEPGPIVVPSLDGVGRAIGLGPATSPNSKIVCTVDRLARFGFVELDTDAEPAAMRVHLWLPDSPPRRLPGQHGRKININNMKEQV
jgi:hypothetical protein